jgi:hypothetical protein
MRILVGVLLVVAVTAGVAGIATYAYQFGVAQGFAQSAKVAVPGPYPAYPYPGYPYGYPLHGPFGFGFFGLLFPILFIFLVFALMRGMFWRRYGGGGHWERGVPHRFEEWHRRAHESKGSTGAV